MFLQGVTGGNADRGLVVWVQINPHRWKPTQTFVSGKALISPKELNTMWFGNLYVTHFQGGLLYPGPKSRVRKSAFKSSESVFARRHTEMSGLWETGGAYYIGFFLTVGVTDLERALTCVLTNFSKKRKKSKTKCLKYETCHHEFAYSPEDIYFRATPSSKDSVIAQLNWMTTDTSIIYQDIKSALFLPPHRKYGEGNVFSLSTGSP